MLTVACVLRSGGEYGPDHVRRLRDGVATHLRSPHRFVCLTDMASFDHPLIEVLPLLHPWLGWWPKIELFRSGLFNGPVFYIDLDTIIVGSLDGLVSGHQFTVLENFWAAEYQDWSRIGSGLMAWSVDLSSIYHRFVRNDQKFIEQYRTRARWGDQGFIKDHTPVEPERWQRKYPGKVVSFKGHVLKQRKIPEGASVVCFHGKPRPWQLSAVQRSWFESSILA